MNDLVADMLTRIQNAIMRRKDEVAVINTKMNASILEVVKGEGMIEDYKIDDKDIVVKIAYNENEPVITKLQKVSKPGQRIYVTKKEIVPIMNGRGISVISTSKGLMTGAMAKSQNLGGEFICKIW
ncbi:TPA: 30S ribosomal protein S8 [Candidatus Dojkabacteria bacterium]|uniref:Small ribosomal subunit protein uS8 n=1 Tax=Candidatus Dojkabacteria bacterium TaxID=2099670 RepID=A0A832RCR0_9BACT|nr:30S ribosomal protein S8 [Candidatus Dojkabacteria bacterium]